MSDDASAGAAAFDLTDCGLEPIHIPGRIQSFGYLVAVSPDWSIIHVSANLPELFGDPAATLVGRPLADYVTVDAMHDIRSRLQTLAGPDSVERLFRLRLTAAPERHDVAVHMSGPSIVIEIEPHPEDDPTDPMRFVRPMVDRIQGRRPSTGSASWRHGSCGR